MTADPIEAAGVLKSLGYNDDFEVWKNAISVSELEKLERESETLKGLSPAQALSSTFRYRYAQAAWAHYGLNTIVLTDSLVANLILTDCEQTAPPPFGGFLVRFTTPIAKTGASCVLFHQFHLDHPEFGSMVSMIESRPDGSSRPSTFLVREDLNALSIRGWDQGGLTMRVLFRNLCSFLAAKVEPLELDNAKAVARAQWTGKPTQRVFTVGRTVKLSRELRDAARVVASGERGPMWKLQNRYVVHGHFRWQPVGRRLREGEEGPIQAKKTWIEPHWKGPEGAEAWQHTYEVSDDAGPIPES